jgi:cation diffusion facilitator family transporter
MSAHGGSKAIIAALLANTGIAVTKFIAAFLSGSASMLAEGVHSVADAGNQLLLLIGKKRSQKAADAEHPFGYGRTRYVYAFIVAIILFSVGGVYSLYEGIHKVQDPHPLDPTWWWLPLVVLAVAIGLESFSLRTAVRESNLVRGNHGWVAFIRRSKAPELPVVLLEDVAALIGLVLALFGVGLTAITGNGLFDGFGTIAIGLLLVAVAVILGIEMKSLLVGEGANVEDDAVIRATIEAHPKIVRLIHSKTLYVGPEELLVAAKIGFDGDLPLSEVSEAIDEIETSVREKVPVARIIYLEADVYRVAQAAPPTDTIVIKSAD